MFKSFLLSLLIVCFSFGNSFSQTINPDSLKKIAVADVKQFKLDDKTLKKFKENRSNSTSDFFKPSKLNTSNSALLSDSVYVKAFRKEAYKKTKKANVTGHHKRVGILGYVAAIAFIGLVFIGLNKI